MVAGRNPTVLRRHTQQQSHFALRACVCCPCLPLSAAAAAAGAVPAEQPAAICAPVLQQRRQAAGGRARGQGPAAGRLHRWVGLCGGCVGEWWVGCLGGDPGWAWALRQHQCVPISSEGQKTGMFDVRCSAACISISCRAVSCCAVSACRRCDCEGVPQRCRGGRAVS